MRILVIHPEDELLGEPWALQRWDRVIDLGCSGAGTYAQAMTRFGCPISRLSEFRTNFREMRRVRELLALGMGRLNDSLGLDWWELTAIIVHHQMELAFLLQQLLESFGRQDEVHVSRPSFYADVLRLALGSRLHTFSSPIGRRGGLPHYLQVLKKFPVPQLLEIFWDKADPGYQFRGSFNRKISPSSGAQVLLPSAYVNVSRAAVAYAEGLPEVRFLLVVTRRSGWLENRPSNISAAWLRRYASVRSSSRRLELLDLTERWERLRSELMTVPELRTLAELGWLNDFPHRIARGLEVRDAWRNVLDREAVQAVICADDTNPYTLIPLLLARQRKLAAVSCHHGALDGRYMFKREHADVLLAKGRMEQDYLQRVCGMSPKTIEVGAPALPAHLKQTSSPQEKPFIVFFSELYEVASGRARDFYQDTLPALADLAMAEGRQLIVKLHPSESFAERNRLVERILSPEQRGVTQVVGGPLQSELLDRAWLGVTIMSTVVVECALRAIPCFLCAWLEAWPYGYDDQFTRFDVGIRLNEPREIGNIPAILRSHNASSALRENCWSPIEPQRLRVLLGMDRASVLATR